VIEYPEKPSVFIMREKNGIDKIYCFQCESEKYEKRAKLLEEVHDRKRRIERDRSVFGKYFWYDAVS